MVSLSYLLVRKQNTMSTVKPVTLSCEGNALLSLLMIEEIEKEAVAVGGLTLGADPLVCGVAQRAYYSGHRHVDALIVRKNPMGHGTKVIEGNKPEKGAVVTVLEDVSTTGSRCVEGSSCSS